jgi:uncharacterized membrane-anchored protein YhcB (DUF1043 family)
MDSLKIEKQNMQNFYLIIGILIGIIAGYLISVFK